jgi:hypothetical protein
MQWMYFCIVPLKCHGLFFFFAKLNVMDLMLFNEHRDIPIMAIFSRDCRLLQLKPPSVFSHSVLMGQ